MTTDIPIKYINATTNTDFEVVVFTKNFSTNTPKTYYAAWQVLRGQTSVQFVYPVTMSVGATYKSGGQLITAGPFPAKLGSTWEITQESATDTAVLKQSKCDYIIYNILLFTYNMQRVVFLQTLTTLLSSRMFLQLPGVDVCLMLESTRKDDFWSFNLMSTLVTRLISCCNRSCSLEWYAT